jgi:hypothetical protein
MTMHHSPEKRICPMCGGNLDGHPHCEGCSILLESQQNDATLCRCGKHHNAPSEIDPRYCRTCRNALTLEAVERGEIVGPVTLEAIPTGRPSEDPTSIVEEAEEQIETEA